MKLDKYVLLDVYINSIVTISLNILNLFSSKNVLGYLRQMNIKSGLQDF